MKLVIEQQLTLERVGFEARLEITSNESQDPITDFSAVLTFENPLFSTNGPNDASPLFFVRPPTVENITSVSGDGIIVPGSTAIIRWFIIPNLSAGGSSPDGVRYLVGCRLAGKLRGVAIPPEVMFAFPADIFVKPEPQLDITYFQPRDVMGDNPFTPQVESPIPFTFGVLVKNSGYGVAHSVVINSQQPKIVENKQNLLMVAQLLGSRVNDSALANANLTVNLGDLQPGQAAKGAWDMITTLSGTFLSVNASYTHSSDLGGQQTSIIKSLNAYLFLHEVLDDLPGRDNLRDFLADTSGALDSIGNMVPDSLWGSDGNVLPVNVLTNAAVTGSGNPAQVSLTADVAGWGYLRLDDPQQAKLPITSILRSDGKVLNTNNYWTSIHYEPTNNFQHTYLNIFDRVDLGAYSYTVTYGAPLVSTNPPVTTLLFAGQSLFSEGVYYVTPDTQMYFISQDLVPVSIYYSLDNGPFLPGYPFNLTAPGLHQVVYYATDASGNQETNRTALLAVTGASSLDFAGITVPSGPFFGSGDALSIRPGTLPISFQAQTNPTPVNARVEIFQGVVAWPTVAGVPSSPTAGNAAALQVAGQNVDFYKYQLNHGAWSPEQPVASPLALSGLPAGTNLVAVLGRSQYGGYLDASNAVVVSWTVAPTAPPTVITGTPATPVHSDSAQLTVGGAGVNAYRWTINNGYYRAESGITNTIVLTNLSTGWQSVSVIGKTNGVYQSTNVATTVAWTVNPLYGYDLSSLASVRGVGFSNIGTSPVTFTWDGRSDAGILQPPGWYTVRVTLTDLLGHTNFALGLAQLNSLTGTNLTLADVVRGPKNPHARGCWAVWEDQSDGYWQIYAQNLTASNSSILKLTSGLLSQENPKTDGRYVVWQARQPNGNWDIDYAALAGTNGPQPLTSSLKLDEINPAMDWPWVVYQVRPTTNSSAPWQLHARNLATGQAFTVSPSTQDELNPDVQAGRVVWQDLRDVGPGEIYLQNLESGEFRRITTNTFGQYHPVVYDHWIVWEDARNTQLDLYGFDLLRNCELRLTSTPQDEARPALNGPWVLFADNALGAQTGNAKLLHLPSLLAVPVTRTATLKEHPVLADGRAVWQETVAGQSRVAAVGLPSLQAVFQNRNTVPVTDAMVAYAQNAYGLLTLWASNGVQAITEYTALVPQVTSQTATWTNGASSGANFPLVAGTFLWVSFNQQQVLDLGLSAGASFNLAAGANVFGCTAFPDAYSAYQLLRQLGLHNARAVRMLDAESGRWCVAEVQNGALVGNDFPIPNTAVLMLELANPVNQFTPQSP